MSVRIDLMLLKTNCRSIGLPRGRFNEPHTTEDVCAPRHLSERLVILWERFLAHDVLSGGHNNSANFVKDFLKHEKKYQGFTMVNPHVLYKHSDISTAFFEILRSTMVIHIFGHVPWYYRSIL